jgi:hypothetical protein
MKKIVTNFHNIPKINNYGYFGTPKGFKKAPHILLTIHKTKAIIYGQRYTFK